jgi:hypothetical protein
MTDYEAAVESDDEIDLPINPPVVAEIEDEDEETEDDEFEDEEDEEEEKDSSD